MLLDWTRETSIAPVNLEVRIQIQVDLVGSHSVEVVTLG